MMDPDDLYRSPNPATMSGDQRKVPTGEPLREPLSQGMPPMEKAGVRVTYLSGGCVLYRPEFSAGSPTPAMIARPDRTAIRFDGPVIRRISANGAVPLGRSIRLPNTFPYFTLDCDAILRYILE
jgi:hypothetical protein